MFIDLDTGWIIRADLRDMDADYAKIFLRRLSKKRRIYSENELMAADVIVPNMQRQKVIVGAIKTIDTFVINLTQYGTCLDELYGITGDVFYTETDKYAGNLYGELNDYRFLLIDKLMGV